MPSLKITVCESAEDAIAKGFDYREKPKEFIGCNFTQVVIIKNGMVGGNPSVDLILQDAKGHQYVAITSGRLLAMAVKAAFAGKEPDLTDLEVRNPS